VAADPDWRALQFLLRSHWPKLFSEYSRTELSGVDGSPIQVQQNPFKVIVELGPDPNTSFTVIDHTNEHKESLPIPDPWSEKVDVPNENNNSAALSNEQAAIKQSIRNQANALGKKWHRQDPLTGRLKTPR
jgi:hypothetical protein